MRQNKRKRKAGLAALILTVAVAAAAAVPAARSYAAGAAAVSNADFFTDVTGGTIEVSDDKQPVISLTPAAADGDMTFEYTELISADVMDGVTKIVDWTFNTTFTERQFRAMSVTMEDSEDPARQLVVGIAGNQSDGLTADAAAKVGFSDDANNIIYGQFQDSDGRLYLGKENNYSATVGDYIGDEAQFWFTYDNEGTSNSWDGTDGRTVKVNTSPCTANLNWPGMTANYYQYEYSANSEAAYEALTPEQKDELAATPIPELFPSGQFRLRFKFYKLFDDATTIKLNAIAGQDLENDGLKERTPPAAEVLRSTVTVRKNGENIEQVARNCVNFTDISGVASVAASVADAAGVPTDFTTASGKAGTYLVTLTATDNSGNSGTASVTVHVTDGFTLPDNYAVNLSAGESAFPTIDLPDGYAYKAHLLPEGAEGADNALSSGLSYAFEDVGRYRILYVVWDAELTPAEYYVGLEVVDREAPVMTFDGSYREAYAPNERLTLLVPVLSDNNPAGEPSYTVQVTCDGTAVPSDGGTVTLSQSGTYTVTYTARDKSGNTSTEIFTFTNLGVDDVKPTITLGGQYLASYAAGSRIEIIAATVTDNTTEAVEPTVEVTINGNIKTVADGGFTADETGICAVRYIAADAAGNRAVLSVEFEITPAEEKKCGCGGMAAAGPIGILAGLALLGGLTMIVRRTTRAQ